MSIEFSVHTSKYPGKLLVVSGIHGNEGGIIKPLSEYIESRATKLPSIVFIPQMSPSALAKGTRDNGSGHNLNRIFGNDINDKERDAISEIVRENGPYDLVASFHEDAVDPYIYFYETGIHSHNLKLDTWRRNTQKLGLKLLNGVDDPSDPAIGYVFDEGFNHEAQAHNSGAFEHWVVMQKLTPRCLTFEIPGTATLGQKQKEIEEIFSDLILPDFKFSEKNR